jgi:hypothetical protein
VIGICKRKLNNARNDFVTIPLLGLPIASIIVAAVLYQKQIVTKDVLGNDLLASAIYMAGYLGAPGLIAEFLVRERVDKLRNVLTVMGYPFLPLFSALLNLHISLSHTRSLPLVFVSCDFKAYWIGTLLADLILLTIPMCVLFLTWFGTPMEEFFTRKGGLCFFLLLVFQVYLVAFSYIFSYSFLSPKSCVAILPIIVIILLILPNIILLLLVLIFDIGLNLFSLGGDVTLGILLWGTMLFSPHGALFVGLIDIIADFSQYISAYPPIEATLVLMIAQTVIYLLIVYWIDISAVMKIQNISDPNFNESCLNNLDEDVIKERQETLAHRSRAQVEAEIAEGAGLEEGTAGTITASAESPLRIERLRKVYPPKRPGGKAVVATQDICFHVQKGEIFGLLGANGISLSSPPFLLRL